MGTQNIEKPERKKKNVAKKTKPISRKAKPIDKKVKAPNANLEELLKENALLKQQVKEFSEAQMEMKEFVDLQIETNERLMIAETKLKKLAEKENEDKLMLDQTVEKLKDTQGQLIHNEKMASLGQLTAGIAHEINNPINFVFNGINNLKVNFTEILELLEKYKELESSDNSKALLEEIQLLKEDIVYDDLIDDVNDLLSGIKEGAVRTIEIVKGLRVFSRLDEEELKEANINECLSATIVLLNNKLKEKVILEKKFKKEIPNILCYPGQLNQVFMNIINNAIQAFPEEQEDAKLFVSTEESDEHIVIKIKDNGIGMSKETQQKIFEPFFTTKPVGVGTGLGLSISYGIIQKHEGNIEVSSNLGEGTEFTITLFKSLTPESA